MTSPLAIAFNRSDDLRWSWNMQSNVAASFASVILIHDLRRLQFHLEKLAPKSRDMGKLNTLRPRQNGRHFADDTFNRIFVNENVRIMIKFSLKFFPKGPINNIPALVQIMAWRWPGDKPLSEPVMVSLLTHICVTRPQWVNNVLFCKVPLHSG